MRENLDRSGSLYFSEAVLLALVNKGLPRQKAYVMVQRCALAAFDDLRRLGASAGGRFRELLGIDADVSRYLTSGELDACFDLDHHLRHAPLILERALAESS
jgi:adenylosuccinate lyase